MPSDSSVIADPASGEAFVAGSRVAMSAAANGAFRFGGSGGSVLRPLTFAERTELVSAASAMPAARDAVAAAILASATLERGTDTSSSLLEVLAMWLAGAAFDAPDFMETTLLVARAAAWPPHELFAAPAREVDRLAVHLDEQRRASSWKSFVFAEPPAESIDAVRARFADRLLRRSVAAMTEDVSSSASDELPSSSSVSSSRASTSTFVQGQDEGSRALSANAVQSAVASPQVAIAERSRHLPHSSRGQRKTLSLQDRSRELEPRVLSASVLKTTIARTASPLRSQHSQRSQERDRCELSQTAFQTKKPGATASYAVDARSVAEAANAQGSRSVNGRVRMAARPLTRPSATLSPQAGRGAMEDGASISEVGSIETSSIDVFEFARESRTLEPTTHHATPADDLASALASLLDDEADLRGVER